jgi:Spx/MgsR family transcriptional regulator
MKPPVVYGIKNCDTMKKAFSWLEKRKIPYVFHDYKKNGADESVLNRALDQHGWENVLNRKGTTWRGLSQKTQDAMDDRLALKTALENPSIIRRPLIANGKDIHLGFDEAAFKKIFA